MSEKMKPNDRAPMVRGRVRESLRLARNSRGRDRKVIVYYRYLFTDTRRYLSQVGILYKQLFRRAIAITTIILLIE